MSAAPDDPYRAPTEVRLPGEYPATACPACKTQVTFLRSCLQVNPARFRCPACKACFGYVLPKLGCLLTALIPCTYGIAMLARIPGRSVDWPLLTLVAPVLGVLAFLGAMVRLVHTLERRYARLFDLPDA